MAFAIGAIAAAGVLFVIASGKAGFDVSAGFAANGFAAHSPGGYSMTAALVTEVVLTCFFILVILGATDRRAPAGFAPIPIGLCLTLIHLIGIPVTNLSVNPARHGTGNLRECCQNRFPDIFGQATSSGRPLMASRESTETNHLRRNANRHISILGKLIVERPLRGIPCSEHRVG